MTAAFSDPPTYSWAELPEPLLAPPRFEHRRKGKAPKSRAARLKQSPRSGGQARAGEAIDTSPDDLGRGPLAAVLGRSRGSRQ